MKKKHLGWLLVILWIALALLRGAVVASAAILLVVSIYALFGFTGGWFMPEKAASEAPAGDESSRRSPRSSSEVRLSYLSTHPDKPISADEIRSVNITRFDVRKLPDGRLETRTSNCE